MKVKRDWVAVTMVALGWLTGCDSVASLRRTVPVAKVAPRVAPSAAVQAEPNRVTSLAAHANGTCALVSNGSVACWGERMRAPGAPTRLGDRMLGRTAVVPELVRGLPAAVEIGVGTAHRCARTRAGKVWCWGSNKQHQLGRATERAVDFRPMAIPGLAGVTRMAVGGELTCVQDGADVRCWGALGWVPPRVRRRDGARARARAGVARSFVLPKVAGGGAGFAVWHDNVACVRAVGGALSCWDVWQQAESRVAVGYEPVEFGEISLFGDVRFLLHGDDEAEALTCERERQTLVCGGGFEFASAQAAVGGPEHMCALDHAGRVSCGGLQVPGPKGSDGFDVSQVPVPPVGVLVGGVEHACALTKAGEVLCWGRNLHGQLGDGGGGFSSEPVRSVQGVERVVVGAFQTCAEGADGWRCTTTSGPGECGVAQWGAAHAGGELLRERLGLACFIDGSGLAHCPLGPKASSTKLALPAMASLASRSTHRVACGVSRADKVVCERDGTVGDVPELGPARAVAVGRERVCAALRNGGVKCAAVPGSSGGGVGFGPGVVTRLPDAKYVSLSMDPVGSLVCAVTIDGVVHCDGDWESGPVGNRFERRGNVELPKKVRQVAVHEAHACAIVEGGALHCWGSNEWGQLGAGPTACRVRPVNITNAILKATEAVPSGVER